jgi:hypothetical protein
MGIVPLKCLKSWVIENSLDFINWTEIDRKRDNSDLQKDGTASFAVSNSAQCRSVRLSPAGDRRNPNDQLVIRAVEFFGILFE